MSDLGTVFQMKFLLAAKEKIAANFNKLPYSVEDAEFSKLIFRGTLDEHHSDVINAHIKAIHTQLENLTTNVNNIYLKQQAIIVEFSKSITLFNTITKSFEIDGGVVAITLLQVKIFIRVQWVLLKSPLLFFIKAIWNLLVFH
jgi:hypothetical protein